MPDVFEFPSERWLAEFLDRCTVRYRRSRAYRDALNRERAPLLAATQSPRIAA